MRHRVYRQAFTRKPQWCYIIYHEDQPPEIKCYPTKPAAQQALDKRLRSQQEPRRAAQQTEMEF